MKPQRVGGHRADRKRLSESEHYIELWMASCDCNSEQSAKSSWKDDLQGTGKLKLIADLSFDPGEKVFSAVIRHVDPESLI